MSRPTKFITVEEVEYIIDEYFNNADITGEGYSLSLLALELGVDRETLTRWKDANSIIKGLSKEDNTRLSNAIKNAKTRIEGKLELKLQGKTQVAGTIFILKNNYGWKDTQEINTTSSSTTNVTGLSKEELKELIYGTKDN